MNYKQKYNASLEQAKKELKTCGSMDCDAARLIFRLFPQFREDEDEIVRKRLIDFFESLRVGHVTTKWEGLDIQSIIAYLEKQKEQKPAEWSEEDLQHKSWILECLADGKRKMPEYAEDFRAAYKWLKSLRPQPKAELTLLDENIIKAAVAFVEQNDHFNCWSGIDKHTVIKALRSLRHSWKPSEEQMEALKTAMDRNDSIGYNLGQLYEQLKKL